MKLNKLIVLFITFIFLYFVPLFSLLADTHYISPTGNDYSGNGTSTYPWATLSGAFGAGAMSSGDTLIIKDGTYTGDLNRITNTNYPPLGGPGAWTVIKAEHDGEAIFDGGDTGKMFDFEASPQNNKYWQFEGLIWCKTTESNIILLNSNYVKFLKCGAYDVSSGNNVNFYLRDSNHVLFENCYAYGTGRYKFLAYFCDKVIFRSCVGRLDYVDAGSGGPIGGFVAYHSTNIYFQNCIFLDSNLDSSWIGDKYAAFYVVRNSTTSENIYFKNCIALNCKLAGIQVDTGAGLVQLDNSVIWDCYKNNGSNVNNYLRGNDTRINFCTIGIATMPTGSTFHFYCDGVSATMRNTIVYSLSGGYALRSITKDYLDFDSNTANDYDNAPGSNSHYAGHNPINPIYNISNNSTGGLKYITRIESGSNLSGQGEGGVDIGANVTTLIGTPGSLWDDVDIGYKTNTGVSMWPFPNEDLIRAKMKVYTHVVPDINGDRGFCVGEKTLTKYIWGYLGNTMPAEIYNDNIAPATTSNLIAGSITNTAVALSWTAPGDDENSGQAASYDIRYSTSNITVGNWASATQVSGEPNPSASGAIEIFTVNGLTAGTTYYFALKTQDNAGNVSGISNIVSVTTSGNSGGGGGGGCFIATAVYGSPMAKEEQALCKFRDNYLLTTKLGRKFVKFYYKVSPPLANYISNRLWARRLVREMLKPLVWIAKKAIKE